MRFIIPEGAQHDLAQKIRLITGNRNPDVFDTTRAPDIRQDGSFARHDVEAVVIAAGAVPAGGAARGGVTEAGKPGERAVSVRVG